MNKPALIALCLLVSFISFGAPKGKCKKSLKEVSCAKVEGSKREFFCAKKGKVSEDKKQKMCKTKKKNKSKKIKQKKALKKKQ